MLRGASSETVRSGGPAVAGRNGSRVALRRHRVQSVVAALSDFLPAAGLIRLAGQPTWPSRVIAAAGAGLRVLINRNLHDLSLRLDGTGAGLVTQPRARRLLFGAVGGRARNLRSSYRACLSMPVMSERGVDSSSVRRGQVEHWFGRSFPGVVGSCGCAGAAGRLCSSVLDGGLTREISALRSPHPGVLRTPIKEGKTRREIVRAPNAPPRRRRLSWPSSTSSATSPTPSRASDGIGRADLTC